MRQVLSRPRAFAVGVAAVVVVVLIIGAIVLSIYIFGAGGPPKTTAEGTITVPTLASDGSGTLFTIDSASSKATFTIDEVLFGKPNTVVGQTSQVAGQILVDQRDPSKSQLGEIKVNLSTLVTDNDLRNRTLQGRILETSQSGNQYATFAAKSMSGLPESITIGQQVSFKIIGDLTIHGVTKTVAFDVQAKLVSAKQLAGQAQATVKYIDFNIVIPNVPSVTGVGDSVKLALDFTANAS